MARAAVPELRAAEHPDPPPRYRHYDDHVCVIDATSAGQGLALGWRITWDPGVNTSSRPSACFSRPKRSRIWAFDVAKPDRHVNRAIAPFGLIPFPEAPVWPSWKLCRRLRRPQTSPWSWSTTPSGCSAQRTDFIRQTRSLPRWPTNEAPDRCPAHVWHSPLDGERRGWGARFDGHPGLRTLESVAAGASSGGPTPHIAGERTD